MKTASCCCSQWSCRMVSTCNGRAALYHLKTASCCGLNIQWSFPLYHMKTVSCCCFNFQWFYRLISLEHGLLLLFQHLVVLKTVSCCGFNIQWSFPLYHMKTVSCCCFNFQWFCRLISHEDGLLLLFQHPVVLKTVSCCGLNIQWSFPLYHMKTVSCCCFNIQWSCRLISNEDFLLLIHSKSDNKFSKSKKKKKKKKKKPNRVRSALHKSGIGISYRAY